MIDLPFLRMEARRHVRQPFLWLCFAALSGIFLLYYAARGFMLAEVVRRGVSDTRGIVIDLQAGLGLYSSLAILFITVLTAVIFAFDFHDKGIQLWLMRGVSRPALTGTRILLVTGTLLLLTLLAFALLLILAILSRWVFLGGFSTANLAWDQLPLVFTAFFLSFLPYAALTVLLCVLTRSPILGAAAGLLFRVPFENMLEGFLSPWPHLLRWVPNQVGFVLRFTSVRLDASAAPLLPPPHLFTLPQSALVALALSILFFLAAMLIFPRQDWGG